MKPLRFAVFLCFLCACVQGLAQSSFNTRTTRVRLQGSWVLRIEGNPIFRPPAEYTELNLVFRGDSMYWIQPLFGDTLSGKFSAWTDIERQQEAMALRKDGNPNEAEYTYANSLQQNNYLACMLYDRVGPSKEVKWDNFSLGEQFLIFYEVDQDGHRWKMLMEKQ